MSPQFVKYRIQRLRQESDALFSSYAFFSGWMGKAGVVPLFSLACFLFRPRLFLFLALLFFVTRVFETTKALLLANIQLGVLFVKISPFFFSSFIYASIPHVLVLSKGEVREIKTEDTVRYTISRRDVIGHKFFSKSKKMMLKGKKRGISQLILWKASGQSHKVTLFVQSRKELIAHAEFLPALAALGADFNFIGQKIEIKGTLKNLKDYRSFSKIINRQKDDFFIVSVSVSQQILKEAIADIYFDFLQHYRDSISCRYEGFQILCHYYYFDKKEDELVKRFEERYMASFTAYKRQYTTNFKVITKTVLIEGGQGALNDLGIEKISTTIGHILNQNAATLFSEENIEIAGSKIHIYSFTEQESLIRMSYPLEIKIGTDRRFHRIVDGQGQTHWYFTGLQINLTLKRLMGKFFVDYSTSLSSEASDTLNKTNSKESSFFISLGQYQKVFEIKTTSKNLSTSSMPLLSHIPVLKNIFKKESKLDSNIIYRTYVMLEKI